MAWDIDGDPEKVLSTFLGFKHKLSNQRYWELLRSVWITAGNTENAPTFVRLFTSLRPHSDWFMTPEETKIFLELPHAFKVYRACNSENDGGLSWTLDRTVAERFQKEFGKRLIIERIVSPNEVYAYIERRGEKEIIILPPWKAKHDEL